MKNNGWVLSSLRDLVVLNTKVINDSYPHKVINYLDTASVTNNVFDEPKTITLDEAPSRAKRLVSHNDTIISTVRPNQKHFGYIYNPPDNLIVSTGFVVVSPLRIDGKFLYYLLTHDAITEYLNQIAETTTTAYPSFQPNLLYDLEFVIPENLPEQRAIAEVLSALDDKIELNRRMNRTLEQLAQAIYKHMFIDNPEREKWEEIEIRELASVTTGVRPINRNNEKVGVFQIPLFGGGGIMAYTDTSLFTTPILLTGRVGTLGLVFRIPYPCWASDNTLIMQLINPVNYEYLYYCVRLIDFNSLNRGSTQPLIAQSDIQKEKVLLPPFVLVEQFHDMVSSFHNLENSIYEENATLAELRDTLLPKLMSGQVRIK